jgi:hypothetical protein
MCGEVLSHTTFEVSVTCAQADYIIYTETKKPNCVNNDTLLFKLNLYGINGKANNWIKPYLVDRYQRVEIKNPNFSHQAASK